MSIVYKNSTFPGIEALSCSDKFHFANHLHSGHVLWLNTACGEQYSVQGTSDILQRGSFGVIEPYVVHSNHPFLGNSRQLRIFYLGEELAEVESASVSMNHSRFCEVGCNIGATASADVSVRRL